MPSNVSCDTFEKVSKRYRPDSLVRLFNSRTVLQAAAMGRMQEAFFGHLPALRMDTVWG